MWVLIWLAVNATNGVDYYHIDTFQKQEQCDKEKTKSEVLITAQRQVLVCVDVSEVQK